MSDPSIKIEPGLRGFNMYRRAHGGENLPQLEDPTATKFPVRNTSTYETGVKAAQDQAKP